MYQPPLGQGIDQAAEAMLKMAKENNDVVICRFNDKIIGCGPSSTVSEIIASLYCVASLSERDRKIIVRLIGTMHQSEVWNKLRLIAREEDLNDWDYFHSNLWPRLLKEPNERQT